MLIEQKEERLIKLREEAYTKLLEGWHNPVRMLELYEEYNNLQADKEELAKKNE